MPLLLFNNAHDEKFNQYRILTKKQITNLVELAKNFKLSDGAFVQESIYPDKTVGALFLNPVQGQNFPSKYSIKFGCKIY
ncbi:MAG: hypothetical protein CM15mP127_04390 [Gammaproteobacteria bacterium]|nr:MAG: hypothetical protein CM15mP127_04390 [Gammaproteobacteria bacterium]